MSMTASSADLYRALSQNWADDPRAKPNRTQCYGLEPRISCRRPLRAEEPMTLIQFEVRSKRFELSDGDEKRWQNLVVLNNFNDTKPKARWLHPERCNSIQIGCSINKVQLVYRLYKTSPKSVAVRFQRTISWQSHPCPWLGYSILCCILSKREFCKAGPT